MSLQHSQKSHHALKLQKKRLTQDQVRVLEASFIAGKKLEPERKFQLARELGVPPRQIAIWYQNKRARWKNQSLELDYGALQLRLEAALADKRQLEKQVESLRAELKRATQDTTAFRSQFQNPVFGSSLSSGGDETTTTVCSSLNDDVGYSGNWGNGDSLKLEELYACLMLGIPKGSNHAPFPGGVK